jgi:hypothetical protein
MNIHYLVRVRQHFNNPLAPISVNRHNMRAWIKSIRFLGDKWLLSKPVQRKTND